MTDAEIVDVVDTYEALVERARRAGKRSAADRKAWAKEAVVLLKAQRG